MARKSKQDVAKAKAAKQKKIAIGGAILLVLILAYEVPKTMKMMNRGPARAASAAVTTPTTTTPAAVTPAAPNSLAAPTLGGTAAAAPTTTTTSSDLVSVVPVSADAGQLQTFERFATKDPFAAQASAGAASGGPAANPGAKPRTVTLPGARSPSPPSGGQAPAAAPPAPTSAVISLNGQLMTVAVGGDFPTAGATFDRVGSIFHLVSLTAKSAKVAIVGGSYADGSKAIPLAVGTPLTLQNTADGTKYTLILEPQGTAVGPSGAAGAAPPASTTPSGATPTTSTPSTVVPTGSGG